VAEGVGWQQWRARRLLALTSTVALAGLRAREAQRLWVSDLDHAAGVINLVPHGASFKTPGSAAPICMPVALSAVLREWEPYRLERPESIVVPADLPWLYPGALCRGPWTGGPSGGRAVDALQAAGERAGVAGLTFQQLRRTFVSSTRDAGVPSHVVARQCRHSEEVSRDWYLARDLTMLTDHLRGFTY
jgi:integrase